MLFDIFNIEHVAFKIYYFQIVPFIYRCMRLIMTIYIANKIMSTNIKMYLIFIYKCLFKLVGVGLNTFIFLLFYGLPVKMI